MLQVYCLCIGKRPEKSSMRQGSLGRQEMVNRFPRQKEIENSKGGQNHVQWPRVT